MSSPEQNAETVNRYLECAGRGAVDEIVDLYASDATVEDPVGGEVHIGREAIRGFYAGMVAGGQFEPEVVTLRALGHEAAFFWRLTVKMGDGGIRIEIISVMTFDDEGKIASMKAYWTPENITQL
jgi:steroid delta-isomerase